MMNSDPLTIRFVCLREGDEEVCPMGRDEVGLECFEDRCENLWLEEWEND